MKKRILSMLLTLSMVLCLVPMVTFAAADHAHCICGGKVMVGDHKSHTDVTYQAWNGTDSITYTNGVAYVYLTGNVTINKNLEVTGGNRLYLCLNGKTLASNGTNKITVKENSRLTISDCAGGGIIKGATSGWGGMCIYIYHSTVDLFGGKLTGGKVTGKGGGGAVALDDADCVLNIYGGEIKGNNGNQKGGGILMLKGTLNIYGGAISDNKSGNNGGAVYVNNGTVNMSGGTISGNKSSNYGGAVYVNRGTLNMSGGKISGNTAGTDIYHGYGGAVCLMFEGSVNMSGGEIVDNHAYRTGGIYGSNNASGTGITMTISGGRITENTASETVKNYGAGVWNSAGTTILKGNPYIRGNYAVLNGTVNNGDADLYYGNGKKRLQIDGLTQGADIGITIGRSKKPTQETPLVFSEACEKNYSGYFTSDDGYDVGYNAETKQLELRVPCQHGGGTLQWTTTPTTHEQKWSCCGLVTVAETAHTWENGKCTVCEYECLHDGGTATCTQKAVCDICGSEYGDFASHSFTAERAEEKYLKSAATCKAKAVYYKSCADCGLTSKDTAGEDDFESGELNASNHTGTPVGWRFDENKHWQVYSCCDAETEKYNHIYDSPEDTMCNICRYVRTISYTVTLNANGGTIADGKNVTAYTYGEGAMLPTAHDMTYMGHTFIGWYDNAEFSRTAVTSISKTDSGNKTYYAKWTEKSNYSVIFISNGGTSIIDKKSVKWTDKVLEGVLNPTRNGYDFAGWKCVDTDVSSDTTYADLAVNDVAESVTLSAQWTQKSGYTVKIDANGGSVISDKTNVKWTDKVLEGVLNPTRNGYDFAGWKCVDTDVSSDTTYADLAVNDTVTTVTLTAQWNDIAAPTGEIAIADNSWRTFLNNITFGLFFKETRSVKITASDNSGETVTVEYLLSDKELTIEELAGKTFTAYSASFNINPDNEYVIYAKLTDTSGNIAYICTDGIVLDATVPGISGIENGKTYCAAQTGTVYEKYIDTVTVNGKTVTLDSDHSFMLNPAKGTQSVVVTDKSGNKITVSVTVNDGHYYEWQSENGQYWQKCKFCGNETAKTDITPISINGADKVCRTQDYKFSLTPPEGVTDVTYGYKFIGGGADMLTLTVENGLYSGSISASDYPAKENSFKLTVRAKTVDGFVFFAEKTVMIQNEHTGGTATCTEQAKCEVCGEEYGELNANNHTDLKHFDAKAATKTSDGNIEYWYCGGCGKYYKDAKATLEITKDQTVTAKLPSDNNGNTGSNNVNNNKPVNDAAASPQTGDNANFTLWIALLFISGGTVTATTVVGRKKKRSVE